MTPRVPVTLVTGPLGSGKTTLLRHILATRRAKIAIVMNEFGEIAIDTKVIQGKNVQIAELGGGCVCCSLLGEFEMAVTEIIEKIAPEIIVVETTGLAEPETLVFWTEHNPGQGPDYGEYVAGLIPGAKYYNMLDAAHWPQWEKPEEHDQVLIDFIKGDA